MIAIEVQEARDRESRTQEEIPWETKTNRKIANSSSWCRTLK